MRKSRQFRIVMATLVGGIVVASSACSVDSLDQTTAPQSTAPAAGGSTGPTFGPSLPDMSKDGTYSVALDPSVANSIVMGANTLEIPAASICAIGSSGYGPTFWDAPCEPELGPVQLTLTINSASESGAAIDFSPALRFNPGSNVVLTLSAPNVSMKDAKDWVILYCPTDTSTTSGNGAGGAGGGQGGNKCVNESLTDKDLRTVVDYDAKQLTRRIKHFSRYRTGYTVAE
jgi:hypothetical protein